MSKTPNKQLKRESIARESAERLGAWLLTGLAIVVSCEMMAEHRLAALPIHSHATASPTDIFSRGEGKGETARLPEEYDIGLQTPHVTGL